MDVQIRIRYNPDKLFFLINSWFEVKMGQETGKRRERKNIRKQLAAVSKFDSDRTSGNVYCKLVNGEGEMKIRAENNTGFSEFR